MNKKELASRWHVSVRAINRLLKLGELKGDLVLNSQNVKNLIDFPLKEIEEYEKLNNIPRDPVNMKEAVDILGVDKDTLRYFKRYMHHVGAINDRLFLFSKGEIQKWKFFLRDKNIETYN